MKPFRQHLGPFPWPGREPQPHRRGAISRMPLRGGLHQVAPHHEQGESFDEAVVAAPEGDGLAPVGGLAVTQEAVQLVVRKHRPVPLAGLDGARTALRAAHRVGMDAQLQVREFVRGLPDRRVVIGDEAQPGPRRRQRPEQRAKGGRDRAARWPAVESLETCAALLLDGAHGAATSLPRKGEAIEKPGVRAGGGGQRAGEILRPGEAVEVVDDDRLRDGELLKGRVMQQQSVATQPTGATNDRTMVAAETAGNLPVGRACHEAGGDGPAQLRALQVIGEREALLGKGATASETKEPGHDAAIAATAVGAVWETAQASGAALVLRAPRPRAEGGNEGLRAHQLDDDSAVHAWYLSRCGPESISHKKRGLP